MLCSTKRSRCLSLISIFVTTTGTMSTMSTLSTTVTTPTTPVPSTTVTTPVTPAPSTGVESRIPCESHRILNVFLESGVPTPPSQSSPEPSKHLHYGPTQSDSSS